MNLLLANTDGNKSYLGFQCINKVVIIVIGIAIIIIMFTMIIITIQVIVAAGPSTFG